jgi:hypothetical protein
MKYIILYKISDILKQYYKSLKLIYQGVFQYKMDSQWIIK